MAETNRAVKFVLGHMSAHGHRGAIRRKLIIWLAVPGLMVLVLAGGRVVVKHRYEQARAVWKEGALRQIAQTAMTSAEVVTEIDEMRHPTPNRDFGWTHEQVLLLTNGEFMVYAFHHGFNNGFIDHLFLAHGSDGRWYYSTYHFCNSMVAVMGDGQPGSIAEFAGRYAVREFDGKSDICLQHTWP